MDAHCDQCHLQNFQLRNQKFWDPKIYPLTLLGTITYPLPPNTYESMIFPNVPKSVGYVSSFPGENPCFLPDFTEVNCSNLEKAEVGYPVGVENP